MVLWRCVLAGVCLWVSGAAQAATVTFQYVGATARVSNVADPEARPGFNTGVLTIDRSRLAGDGSLANRTISYTPYSDDYDPSAEAVSFDFALGTGSEEVSYALGFDAEENLVSWSFRTFFELTPSHWQQFSVSRMGEFYYDYDAIDSTAHRTAESFLAGLGLEEGSPDYREQYCGGWAGPGFDCAEWGGPSAAWSAVFIALDGGSWFRDDPDGYAAQLGLARLAALASPPSSYHDLRETPSTIPVPAPLLLMGSALAGLALMRRRGSRSDRSGKINDY